jgi:heme o synthase
MQATETTWAKGVVVELDTAVPPLSLRQLIVTLFKLRVVSLLLLSAFGGAALGVLSGGQATLGGMLLLALTGTLSAAGASAINQYLERERDTYMKRTAKRPLATGQIASPVLVLWLGLGMIFGASGLAAVLGYGWLAFWLLAGAAIYVGVYTIWLKPRTSLNIVIGGAAGSCAVISGGAAVGMWSATAVWLMALLVFVWTPVHFWALALAYRDDYANAGFPMLPAQVSPQIAARWTALHTVFTAACALALGLVPTLDWPYLILIGAGTIPLVTRTAALLRNPVRQTALPLFGYSNIYLALVIAVIMLSLLWR